MLPLAVLEQAQKELICYGDSGMSVMEMSHRSPVYEEIIKDAEAKLRAVMSIPDNYKVLFLQGGASTQFAAVPLNLLNKNKKADYILSGQFSTKAYKEAQKYGDVVAAASSKDDNFSRIPETTRESFRPDADYVHICYNNPILPSQWPADSAAPREQFLGFILPFAACPLAPLQATADLSVLSCARSCPASICSWPEPRA